MDTQGQAGLYGGHTGTSWTLWWTHRDKLDSMMDTQGQVGLYGGHTGTSWTLWWTHRDKLDSMVDTQGQAAHLGYERIYSKLH